MILEFSHPVVPGLKPLYDAYSFSVLPWLGKVVARDEASYRYLAESIRKFPNQPGADRDDAGGRGWRTADITTSPAASSPCIAAIVSDMRLTPLESLLNRNIAASSAARALCRSPGYKVMALHVEGMPLSIYFKSDGERMSLDTQHEGTPNATLSGTTVVATAHGRPAPKRRCERARVHIHGDAEVAQTFSELLKQARPDLEEELSRVIGDVAAHQVGNVARSALGFARRAADTFAQNVSEYLQEEGRDAPSRTEAG